ncbi:MAG: hypothetical protein ACYC8T_02760 [Myxococcaceae bacterium]
MSADRAIAAWLVELGYGLPESSARARAALEEESLTRPGKLRMSDEKLPRGAAALSSRFYLWCGSPGCEKEARASGRELVRCEPRTRCERCGGSDNRRAETELIEAFRRAGARRLLVVGGSPSVREELEKTLGDKLELRMVDGTERRTSDRARADLEWADLALVWGASELHHKVSTLYTGVGPPLRRKVVLVAKRGVAALLAAAVEHLARTG